MPGLHDAPLTESRRRRPHAWTCGELVSLADSSSWSLPQVDLALIYVADFQRSELLRRAELSRSWRGTEGFSPRLVDCPVHLARVGRRLLQIN